MKIFSPILKGTTTVAQGTTNLSGSFTGSLFGTAATASYADNFTVGGTLTAQTINVQIITSSIEFNTGSTRNGALSTNTHQFTGSVLMSGSLTVGGNLNWGTTTASPYMRTIGGTQIFASSVTGSNYLYSGGTDFRLNNQADTLSLLTITNAGNVGIGTTSPYSNARLQVNTGTNINLAFQTGTTDATGIKLNAFNDAGSANIPFELNGSILILKTAETERMRITSDGKVYVGITSLTSPGTFNAYTNNTTCAARFVAGPSQPDGNITLMVDKYSTTNTTSQWFLGFTINNQAVASGVITANGASQAAFGSWSDRRLKENITDLPNQLSNILALRPVEFDYIESEGGGHQTSFIAQEFEEIYPDAVGQRPDGMKTLTGWGKTEAILVKAIQELKSENDTLKEILQRNNIQ
jgi:hypothetical protein